MRVCMHMYVCVPSAHVAHSEHFNTAGRSVGTGLIAAVIVSQWTWAATLLQSSTVAHKYGISVSKYYSVLFAHA